MLVVKYPEIWATDHRQRWHSEALQMLGERVVVRHRWNIQDFALGLCRRCTVCADSQHVNEVQRIRTYQAANGTFKLAFGDEITADIEYNQTAEGVQLALEQLSTIEAGDIQVTGETANNLEGLIIEFSGQWAARNDVPLLVADDTNLVGGSVEIIRVMSGAGGNAVREKVTETYKQAGSTWCPSCFGVGFDGGFEPVIYVTYALISDQQAETSRTEAGVIQRADPQAQFSFEPIVQEYDLVARIQSWESDMITPHEVGGRFILHEARPESLRTGPKSVDDTPSFAPPEFRSVYKLPDSDLIIGQTTQIEVIPFEHPYNLVPLTPFEETTVEMGIVEERTWHERPGTPLETNPAIRGID